MMVSPPCGISYGQAVPERPGNEAGGFPHCRNTCGQTNTFAEVSFELFGFENSFHTSVNKW